MKTTFTAPSFNENTAVAQILPLSLEDKTVLKKQKKTLNFIFIGVITGLIGFAGYLTFSQDLPLYLALFVPGPALVAMLIIWYLGVKKLNDAIVHSVKQIGTARVISKARTSATYWLVLDGPFKEMKRVYVSAGMYFSVQQHDLVRVEVLPTSKAALSLKKSTV